MSAAIASDWIKVRHTDKLFIGGKWVAPSTAAVIEVISPNTEEVVATVAEAREADMDAAVAAARRAFDEGPWPRKSPQERAAALRALADALARREAGQCAAGTQQV
ncbi:MAG: aldehyde dehydrogenase, partial [Proteobacteria bacterium]